jgi:hypothetical protein
MSTAFFASDRIHLVANIAMRSPAARLARCWPAVYCRVIFKGRCKARRAHQPPQPFGAIQNAFDSARELL